MSDRYYEDNNTIKDTETNEVYIMDFSISRDDEYARENELKYVEDLLNQQDIELKALRARVLKLEAILDKVKDTDT